MMSDNERRGREDIYAETRRDLLARQLSNSERFDAAILTLSSGALGLSLAFIKDIVPVEKANYVALLNVSWWLFGLAIVSTIASFLVSQLAIKKQLHYAEKYYLDSDESYLKKRNLPALATDAINYLSGFLFVSAIVVTIFFVSKNIGGTFDMTKDTTKTVPLREAATIPSLQPLRSDGIERRGAPIPSLQPAPSENRPAQSSGGDSSSGQSGTNSTPQE